MSCFKNSGLLFASHKLIAEYRQRKRLEFRYLVIRGINHVVLKMSLDTHLCKPLCTELSSNYGKIWNFSLCGWPKGYAWEIDTPQIVQFLECRHVIIYVLRAKLTKLVCGLNYY